MNFSWVILASLLTSCALSAPPFHHGQKQNPHSQDPNTKKAELEQVAEEELTQRLQQIVNQAALELEEMEQREEKLQGIYSTLDSNSLTPEQLLLLNKLQENVDQDHKDAEITKLLLAQMLPLDSSLTPEQMLLLSRLSGGQSHRSSGQHDDDLLLKDFLDDRNQDDMSLEQKVLEARLLQGIEMNHEQLLRLAELRAQRSGSSTLQELFLLNHRSEGLTPEQKVLEDRLLQGLEMNHEQLLRLAELRAQRSGSSTLQELFLLNHRSEGLTPEQKVLEDRLLQGIEMNHEQLLRLAELRAQRSGSSTLQELFLLNHRSEGLTPEQKVLEDRLMQGLKMNHEQLLRLAELRAQRSGASTLQELFLLHHRSASLTPEQILILKSLTPSQILKYYYQQNTRDSSSDQGLLGSLISQLSDLARTKVILENTELMLYTLLKNRNPQEGRLSLAEILVINRYQEAMAQSMRRTRFILMMHMMNMSNDMDMQDNDRTPQQQKIMLAAMIHSKTQQMNEKWDKEEALLLMRYRQGKATLMDTLMAYKLLDSMMNSGLGSNLRKIVMNEIRINMMKGSGIGMMKNGTWMNGWMNNMQWMDASDSERMTELWELYKLRFVRNFNSRDHERSRRRNFENKLSEILLHGMEVKLGRQLFSMALNNLTDWSKEELSTLKGFNKTLAEDDYMAQQADVAEGERARTVLPDMPIYTNTIPTSQLPSYVNWTNTSWVGPIQNQGQCGSCWSFSAAGSLEAQYYNKTGTFVTMSEQNLVDCTYYLGNLGCSGGNVELAFDYVMTVGIDTYASYPYTGRANNGVCKYDANNSVTQDVGWRLIPEGNELALQQAVALAGPVSVAIDASLSSFDSYAGGVYSPVNCSTTELDHAVLVVGYGTYEGQDYWLIKNSWGTDWGIYGYMMMERGVNMCGIATSALFPVID